MKNGIIFLMSIILFAACLTENKVSSENEERSTENLNFFFPADTMNLPVTYLYRNSKNPLDERYIHIIPVNGKESTVFTIEKFNRNLKLTEGFQFQRDNKHITVKKHSVSTPITKYEAKLIFKDWFPMTRKDTSHFTSKYPENDSIIQVLDQFRIFENEGPTFDWKGQSLKSIIISNKASLYRNDMKNKKNQLAAKLEVEEIWAEGLGLVAFYPKDDPSVKYELDKILTQRQWAALFSH